MTRLSTTRQFRQVVYVNKPPDYAVLILSFAATKGLMGVYCLKHTIFATKPGVGMIINKCGLKFLYKMKAYCTNPRMFLHVQIFPRILI